MTFYNCRGVFAYFKIAGGHLTNFEIAGGCLAFHSNINITPIFFFFFVFNGAEAQKKKITQKLTGGEKHP
jgi:hypothetical protein